MISKSVVGTTDFWIKAQERINQRKKIKIFLKLIMSLVK